MQLCEAEIFETMAPPQQPRKRGTIFWTSCRKYRQVQLYEDFMIAKSLKKA